MLELMLAEAGLSWGPIARELELDDFSELNSVDYLRILGRCALALRDESFHLASRRLLPGTNEFVLKNIGQSLSVKAALQTIANSYNIIHGGTYNRVEVGERHIAYIIDDQQFPYSAQTRDDYIQFILDNMLVFIHGVLSTLLCRSLQPYLFKLVSRSPSDSILASTFGEVPVRQGGAHYGLYYHLALQDLPIPESVVMLSAELVYQTLHKHLSSQTQPKLVVRVLELLHQGIHRQEELAARMNLSVATLKRKLAAHHTSFRQLREQSLNQRAQQQLLQGLAMDDVALNLGFSDARSFTRAFKGWNGLTPAAFLQSRTPLAC
ncbi:hypothetical protein GCM10027098_27600 [Bowmanella dokdonensis]